jgi:hypothetical protein
MWQGSLLTTMHPRKPHHSGLKEAPIDRRELICASESSGNYHFSGRKLFSAMLKTSINRLRLRRELDLSCREELSES